MCDQCECEERVAQHPLAAEAHRRLDQLLDDYPGTSALLIAAAYFEGVEAVSIPHAISVKRGIIGDLCDKVFGE